MCGLVAIVGEIGPQERNMFEMMMYFNKIRGEQSTGLLTVDPISGETTIVKDIYTPEVVMDEDDWHTAINKKTGLLMGHCRWATINKENVTKENAHPFEFKDLVGMHNGTLNPGYENHLEQSGFGTDSATFYAAMQEKGVEWALERAHGAYAFIWYDKINHTLNIFKNDKRDLTYIQTKDKKTSFFVSEPLFFTLAQKYTRYSKAMDESTSFSGMFHVPNDRIITIDVPEHVNTGHGKASMKEFKTAGTKYKEWNYHGRGSFRGHNKKPVAATVMGPVSTVSKLGHNSGSAVMETPKTTQTPKNVQVPTPQEQERIEKAFKNLDRRLLNRNTSPSYWANITNQITSGKVKRDFIVNELNKKEAQIETIKLKLQKGQYLRNKDLVKALGVFESYEHRKDQLSMYDDLFPESDNLGIKKAFKHFNELEWKSFLRHNSCVNCDMQSINWGQDECYETTDGKLLCPTCIGDAYIQNMINEGTIKIA